MLAFGVIVLSVQLTLSRLKQYLAVVETTGTAAWRRTVDLGVYIAGIATNITTILFSTMTGAVVSDTFKSLPNNEIVSILVLVVLFLSVFRLAQVGACWRWPGWFACG